MQRRNQADIGRRTDALVARAEEVRRTIKAAADELAALTRELRQLLQEDRGPDAR